MVNYFKLWELLIKANKMVADSKEDPEVVRKKQEISLRSILHHAYDHSDFYHEKFEKAGITKDNIDILPITDFPTTDKEELISNYARVIIGGDFGQQELIEFDESVHSGLFRDKWHVVHSSGSTGSPCFFAYDDDSWQRLLLAGTRNLFWGMSPLDIHHFMRGGVRLLYVAVTGDSFGGAAMVKEAARLMRARMLAIDLNEPIENWKKKVIDFRPTMIIGYPSALKIMTEELIKADEKISVRRLVTCAESLSPQQRVFLENYYGKPVVNFYAATESLTLGVETDAETGMILLDDMNYIEVVDGNMYLTNLYNYGQPLIRYRISDAVELLPPLPEGYGFSRCRINFGRADDVMWFTDEEGKRDLIHPTLLEDFCLQDLLGYQFIQLTKDSFRVDIEITPNGNIEEIQEKLHKMISEMLARHRMTFVRFHICLIDHILPDEKTGKCRLCIALPTEKTES